MNVLIDGSIINYQDVGANKGKVILFLHGWADDSLTFRKLSSEFKADYRCISLDFPGFGKSEPPKTALTLSDFADVTEKFLSKIKAKPYAVVAHSNGGAITIKAVADGKLKPQKIVLLASSGIRSGKKLKKTLYKLAAKPAKASLLLVPKNKRNVIRKKLYSIAGSDYMVSEHMKDTFKNIVSYDVASDAAKVKFPTLLIYGTNDDATPPGIGRSLHGLIKGSKLEILEGSGHFVHQDSGQKVEELIKDFL